MNFDKMKIQILADGTIRVVTDPISPANHMNAEQLLTNIARLAGGETTRERRPDAHTHSHHHHTHEEGHKHEH